MKKIICLIIGICVTALVTGCAPTDLKAPCPEYGKYCSKTPINNWDNS